MNKKQRKALALVVMMRLVRKQRKRRRRIWCRQWIANHDHQGAYCNLVKELQSNDSSSFTHFMWMRKDVFDDLLGRIQPCIMRRDTNMRVAISPGERLAVTLRFLATGESFQSLSYQYRIGASTISDLIPETCEAIYSVLRNDFFKFPSNANEWKAVSHHFLQQWNFPNCLGALDGKHINIKPPPHTGSEYYNYKHRFSIVLMALVDAEYKFLYCDIGCNGRVSDGGVFAECTLNDALHKQMANLPESTYLPGSQQLCSYHIVADDAFPLREEIMKPYRHRHLSDEQRVFNYRLSRARRVVEHAFGMLANRFRVFLAPIALAPDKVELLVLAACVLHNYLIAKDDCGWRGLVDSEYDATHLVSLGLSQGLPHNENPSVSAKMKRDMLSNYFSSDAGKVPWQDSVV